MLELNGTVFFIYSHFIDLKWEKKKQIITVLLQSKLMQQYTKETVVTMIITTNKLTITREIDSCKHNKFIK